MPASHPLVPIALGAGTRTAEARAFYLSRLALFGRWVFLTSTAFNLAILAVTLVVEWPLNLGMAAHVAATLVAGAIWAIAGRRDLSLTAAQVVDAAGTILICLFFAVMAVQFAVVIDGLGLNSRHELYVGVMACTYVLFARAIAVPSSPARTTLISALGTLPMVGAIIYVTRTFGVGAVPWEWADPLMWAAAGVVMSAVTSQVIFGLRAEITKVRQLGQYTLEEKIGEGGMGVVYRARHALLRRPTAVKLLSREKAGEDNLHRFEREVQLTAGLSHPSTVAVFDYGRTPDGIFYYAMEFLDGINLEQLVERYGRQPADRVVHILWQVAGALAEAHAVNLVHRDVKPANIILCERGGMPDVAKVVDFGLVKRFEARGDEATLAVTARHTAIGTPLYMAPEAVTADASVDARSDLYALGAVAYFMLTGTPVFSGGSFVEVCAHHLHTPPEPPTRRGAHECPPELEQLILQCLAKSPADRPQHARTLQHALSAIARSTPWSEERAARWWATFRAERGTAKATEPVRRDVTAVVDLANRVNQYR